MAYGGNVKLQMCSESHFVEVSVGARTGTAFDFGQMGQTLISALNNYFSGLKIQN